MDNKNNPEVEKNQSKEFIEKGTQPEKKQRGLIARFLAWIARGTKQAAKDGNFCTR
ncbi:MAG: hypothetical protein RBR67_12315 [Desulfobacterium sp.]|jgi:hypothetical protein|nr:hypothetical protein [Desulfobacterium sp.]